jgi:hypothetical protein
VHRADRLSSVPSASFLPKNPILVVPGVLPLESHTPSVHRVCNFYQYLHRMRLSFLRHQAVRGRLSDISDCTMAELLLFELQLTDGTWYDIASSFANALIVCLDT